MKTVAIAGDEAKVKNYIAALEGVGLSPVVTLSADEAACCAGLLLPGGWDIDPARFHESVCGSENIDPALDEAQFAILDRFVKAKKPVLGVCRGHQLLNVYFGGSLIQHLATAKVHQVLADGQDRIHPITSFSGSILHRLYGPEAVVNSSHHQGLGTIGRGLRVTAFAPDGTVEGAEHESLPILGVQFHPERMCFQFSRPGVADGAPIFQWLSEQL